MKCLTPVVLSLFLSINSQAASLSGFFVGSNRFLRSWVYQGRVDYAKINRNFTQINQLYRQVEQIDLKDASDTERKAFYINAYNVIVIYQVAKHYPLKSPMNHSGFFDKVKHVVAGESITLNALEIEKLSFVYRDPRIHFALACAAQSCPPLASFAYFPNTLDRQLEERTREAINDPAFIRVKKDAVEVSKIFDWYRRDFIQDGQTVRQFINTYRTHKIPGNYPIAYYEYDWQLNEK